MRAAVRGGRCWWRAVAAAGALAGGVVLGSAPAHGRGGEPFAASQWGLDQVRVEPAWPRTRGGGARIGIIDTGIDLGHAELAHRVMASTRCTATRGVAARCGGSAQDDSGHGTHVAGIAAAALDGTGMAGVAPEASLLVVKALLPDGSGEAADAAAGIDWLIDRDVDVVNLSLSEVPSLRTVAGSPLEAAIRRAAAAGAVVVLAAGNHAAPSEERATFDLPAVVVAASTRAGALAPYSFPLAGGVRWGLLAPGGDGSRRVSDEVVSTSWFPGRRDAYAWSEGTSMAAPHVTGAAALLAAQGVRGQAAIERLLATAAPGDCGTGCRGLLDVAAAVGARSAVRPGPTRVAVAGSDPPPARPAPGGSPPRAAGPAGGRPDLAGVGRGRNEQVGWAAALAAAVLAAAAGATARVGLAGQRRRRTVTTLP